MGLTMGPPDTDECAAFMPESPSKTDAHAAGDVGFGQAAGEMNRAGFFSPAILWGILISDYEEDEKEEEVAEAAENSSLDAAEPEPVPQRTETSGNLPDEPRNGSAVLWGTLWSDASPTARSDGSSKCAETEVFDMDAIVRLWIAAGYDCQLPAQDSPAITDDTPTEDGEPTEHQQPSHAVTGPFAIQNSPGKGQGIFASRDIVKGARILADTPFLAVTKPYNAAKVLAEFELMPFAHRRQYMRLHCPDRSADIHVTDVMSIFEANCFNVGHSAAVFLTATRFNHSCLPNTYYSWSETRGEIVLHAMIDVARGEEMTICYGDPFSTRLQRQCELRNYNFRCTCPACRSDGAFGRASESRRLVMRALHEQIIMFQSRFEEALMIYGLQDPLTPVLHLIELVKEEGLHGELMTPYRDAAEYLRGRGNFEEALEYAHLELEEEVVCLGNDSEVVRNTVGYIEGLEGALERFELDQVKWGWRLGTVSVKESPTESDADTHTPEHQHPEEKVPEPEPEPEEAAPPPSGPSSSTHPLGNPPHPAPAQPDAPDQDNNERHGRALGDSETDKQYQGSDFQHGCYPNDTDTAVMDSRSSSPRLVRGKNLIR